MTAQLPAEAVQADRVASNIQTVESAYVDFPPFEVESFTAKRDRYLDLRRQLEKLYAQNFEIGEVIRGLESERDGLKTELRRIALGDR